MSDEARAQDWKDPDNRDEPTEDHPSGQLRLRRIATASVRAALLMGITAATVAGAGEIAETSIHTTIFPV